MRSIKSPVFLLMVLLLSCTAKTQIKNSGFDEPKVDTIASWKVLPKEGYTASLDAAEKHAGTSAMKLSSQANAPGSFMSFSQHVPIQVQGLKRVAVTAYIKAADVRDEATLWCQVLDENGKMIGFENLGTLGMKLSGSSDWQKFTLLLTVNEKARKLKLGGYLGGTGTAWFDDFQMEELDPDKTPAAAPVQAYIREFIVIVKQNSIFTDSLNWPLIEKNVATLSAGVNTTAAARPVINHVMEYLKAAGDNHSFIQEKVAAERYTKENSNPAKPESKLISGNIGYVSVPGFSSTNNEVSVDFATAIQNMIRQLDTENQIKGWVVDLRENTGGNMYPMIAGLGPLTGEATLGYFISMSNKKEAISPWFYKKGSAGAGAGSIVQVAKPYSIKNKAAKVAVLIGPMTSSSGEMTAISFIGKKNAQLFGTSSGGFTTGNVSFKLADGSNLLLASSYTADRNKKRYLKKITPDVQVSTASGQDDAVLKAAEEWLNGK